MSCNVNVTPKHPQSDHSAMLVGPPRYSVEDSESGRMVPSGLCHLALMCTGRSMG
jgi:hypothetical protein